jgi:hypothetical protein
MGVKYHVDSKHKNLRHPCPWSTKANCTATFHSLGAARTHVKQIHERVKYPCPFANEDNCNKTFNTLKKATQHANSVHRNLRYPCPLAEEYNCTATFKTTTYANTHASTIHEKVRYPCPMANEESCNKTFSSTSGATVHANAVHKKLRYPCPLAKEYNCSVLFGRVQYAKDHATSHLTTYPCPVAEEYECKAVFKYEKYAKQHMKIHIRLFICPRLGCNERFITAKDALMHADDPKHTVREFFGCPLPMCKKAVTGKRFLKWGMQDHKETHIRVDDIGADDEYVPQQLEELRLHSDLPLYALILQHDGLDLTNEVESYESLEELLDEDGDLDIEDADFEGTSTASTSGNKEQNGLALSPQEEQELSNFEDGVLSKVHRLRILEQNTRKWSMSYLSRFLVTDD